MLNINELEQRWKVYKLKSYLPHAVISFSLIVIVSIISIVLSKQAEVKTQQTKKDTVVQKQPIRVSSTTQHNNSNTENKNLVADTSEAQVIKKSDKVVLKPSLDFIKDMQIQPTPQPIVATQQEVLTKVEKEIQKPTIQATPVPIVEEVDAQEDEKSINITRKTTQNDINEVIKRFNKNNNPALSLFIAKKYYDLGEYRKSYNYALITNEINNDIESSWIIFAKSLVKLNEKDKAIKTLRKYINHSGSNRATSLLDRITSGKFK